MFKTRFPLMDDEAGAAGGGSATDDAATKAAAATAAAAAAAAAADDKGEKVTDKEAKLLKEVMTKKERIKDLEKQFEGVDPSKYRDLLAKEEKRRQDEKDAETKALEAAGEFSRVKASMVETHKNELTTLQTKLAELTQEIGKRDALVDDLTVGNAFGGSRFISEKLNLSVAKARTIYGPNFEQKEGKLVAFDKPRGAKDRTMLVDGRGEPVDFETAINKLVESDPDRDLILKSTMRSGAASTGAGERAGKKSEDPGAGVDRIAAGLALLSKKK